MKIEFALSVDIEPRGKHEELTEDQEIALDKVLSNLEEVLGKEGLELDDSCWEEV